MTTFALQSEISKEGAFTWDLGTHLILLHNLTHEYSLGLGNGAFWSLGMEEQLYALYAILLILFARFGTISSGIIVLAITLFWVAMTFEKPPVEIGISHISLGSWFHWPFYYWSFWTLGAIAVDAYFGNTKLPAIASKLSAFFTLLFVGILIHKRTLDLFSHTQLNQEAFQRIHDTPILANSLNCLSHFCIAIAFFILVNWAIKNESKAIFHNRASRSVAFLGQTSYSIYLTHVPVIYFLEKFVPFGMTPSDWILRYLVYASVSLAVGILFFISIERWFLTILSNMKRSLSKSK